MTDLTIFEYIYIVFLFKVYTITHIDHSQLDTQ